MSKLLDSSITNVILIYDTIFTSDKWHFRNAKICLSETVEDELNTIIYEASRLGRINIKFSLHCYPQTVHYLINDSTRSCANTDSSHAKQFIYITS